MVILHLVWIFLKLVRGNGVICPSLLFRCFKNYDENERKLLNIFKQTNLPLFENGLATLVYD